MQPARSSAVATDTAAARDAVDFALPGVAGIRLLGATARDAATVERQLGPVRRPIDGDPDVLVRFVERLPLRGDVRLVGRDDAAFTDDAFLVLRGPHKRRLRAKIRFPKRDEPFELVRESGIPSVPLLVAAVNLTALSRGALPMHASAFTYAGRGTLATGWAKGGKTETLLGFMARGAAYIGDEWVYVLPDGSLVGIPEPIRIWDWHLPDLPALRARLDRRSRSRLRALAVASAVGERARRLRPAGTLDRALALVEQQRNLLVPPGRLFGAAACALAGRLDTVLFVVSHDNPATVVHEIDPDVVAARMEFSLGFEASDLHAAYLKYRFAFPDAVSEPVESAEEVRRQLLARAFRGRRAYEVRHPFPASIPALVAAVEPHLVA